APATRLSDALGVSLPQAGERDPFKHWVEINLDGIRNTASNDAGRIGFELRRRLLPSGEFRYTMEGTQSMAIPVALIRTGRRVARPGDLQVHNVRPRP
ncbi:MAG: hypothetical protein WBW32_18460, partial [Luteibacter sp.]